MRNAREHDPDTLQEPRLGWAALSRTRLNKAEAQLEQGKDEGVRDEVGVLALHTAYANRFFPGTSMQQRRLRYALFVPWQIEDLLRGKLSAAQARSELQRREIQLATRLVGQPGVIGARKATDGLPVSIPPSSAYWVALREWGLVNALPGNVAPSRHDMFRYWEKWGDGRAGPRLKDDEGRDMVVSHRLFIDGLPEAPRHFRTRGPLDFTLEEGEGDFLRERLAQTERSFDRKPSLLAALAVAGIVPTENEQLWSRRIKAQADSRDRKAIERARGAASLSAVARALYAAAVEALGEDGAGPTERHQGHLGSVMAEHGARAASLQLETLGSDGVELGPELHDVLQHVQQWIESDGSDPLEPKVYRVLADWECRRKGSRAKLPKSRQGREARRGWGSQDLAEPIGYRWWVVRNLLQDLAGNGHGV